MGSYCYQRAGLSQLHSLSFWNLVGKCNGWRHRQSVLMLAFKGSLPAGQRESCVSLYTALCFASVFESQEVISEFSGSVSAFSQQSFRRCLSPWSEGPDITLAGNWDVRECHLYAPCASILLIFLLAFPHTLCLIHPQSTSLSWHVTFPLANRKLRLRESGTLTQDPELTKV